MTLQNPNRESESKIVYYFPSLCVFNCCRYEWRFECVLWSCRPLLFVGPTGTGKTVYVQQKLMSDLSKETYVPMFISFSARTTANQTQVAVYHTSAIKRVAVFWGGIAESSSAYSDTCYRTMVCPSVCMCVCRLPLSCTLLKPVDGRRWHLAGILVWSPTERALGPVQPVHSDFEYRQITLGFVIFWRQLCSISKSLLKLRITGDFKRVFCYKQFPRLSCLLPFNPSANFDHAPHWVELLTCVVRSE